MFKQRSDENEIMDNLTLAGDDLKLNLDEIDHLNYWLGAERALIKSLNNVYNKRKLYCQTNKIRIADLGCGSGKLLIRAQQWAKGNNIDVELTGIDANKNTIQYAIEQSSAKNIHYCALNIHSDQFRQKTFDIILISNFCHHLNNSELSSLIQSLAQQAKLAVIINDLHRHWVSYYGMKALGFIFRLSKISRNDGPISVKRAFIRDDLLKLMEVCKTLDFHLSWSWAFRWKLIIWCQP